MLLKLCPAVELGQGRSLVLLVQSETSLFSPQIRQHVDIQVGPSPQGGALIGRPGQVTADGNTLVRGLMLLLSF